jgi:hypothetical protein
MFYSKYYLNNAIYSPFNVEGYDFPLVYPFWEIYVVDNIIQTFVPDELSIKQLKYFQKIKKYIDFNDKNVSEFMEDINDKHNYSFLNPSKIIKK